MVRTPVLKLANGHAGVFEMVVGANQVVIHLREHGIVPMAYADTAGAAAFVKEQGDLQACAIAPNAVSATQSTAPRGSSR